MTTAGHGPLRGVFFDMDGTLLDSEPLTDVLILRLVEAHGLAPPDFPLSQFHGVTWERIAAILTARYPALAEIPLEDRLEADFHRLMLSETPPLIAGVQQAFANASIVCRTGIVSSSRRETIDAVARNAGLANLCSVTVGAEDVQRSKPDPECYELAARMAAADTGRCLVFEDSRAGVQAARTAGMHVVGVIGNRDANAVGTALDAAHFLIRNYDDLQADFFTNFACHR